MRVIKQHFYLLALLGLVLGTSGCATIIPETDNLAPEIRLVFNGPVIGRQEMTNPPRESWTNPDGDQLFNFAANTEYGFTFTVSDQGGVARAHLRMPDDFVIISLSPSSTVSAIVGISRSLTLTGSRANPTTGLIISGRFRTPMVAGGLIGSNFLAEGDDFGGSAGRANQRFMDVFTAVQDR